VALPGLLHALGIATAIALVALLMMRILLLPRVGCWITYFTTLVGLFVVLLTGGIVLAAAAFMGQELKDANVSGIDALIISGVVAALMTIGKMLLKAWKTHPFQAFMKWFLRVSFSSRIGKVRPTNLPSHSRKLLAFRAVFDDAYGGDTRYGTVDGWGVRACCKRLLAIKNNR